MSNMKDRNLQINNSYESERSYSTTSLSDGLTNSENKSFDGDAPNLVDMLRCEIGKRSVLPKDQSNTKDHMYCLNDNPVCRNGVCSSQESDFEGYTFSEMETTPSNYIHVVNHNKKCDYSKTTIQPNEKDFQISNHNFDTKSLNTKESNSSLNNNEDIILNDGQIYGIVSSENSCNAVDMVIQKETEEINNSREQSTSCLSFNGRINATDCGNSSSSTATLTSNDKTGNLNNSKTIKIIKTMKYINEKSPDLFEDDDDTCSDTITNKDEIDISDVTIEDSSYNEISRNHDMENIVQRRDVEHLKRIRSSLLGLPPPPSVTITQIDMFNRIANCKEKIFDFFKSEFLEQSKDGKINAVDGSEEVNRKNGSFLKPTHTIEETKNMNWPNILKCNQLGLSYNLSKTSERIELLNLSVIERYIGAETSSSYNAHTSVSSARKRNLRLKMLSQSPGSRLSHLAKRRAIFSSANLQSTLQANVAVSSSASNASKVNNRQILLDSKKSQNRRKSRIITPQRKIGRKTPTSSSRKRGLAPTSISTTGGPTRETSKRALFQSPPKQKPIAKIYLKPEIANRIEKSKRALFSPFKSQESNSFQENSSLFNRINNNNSSGSVYENSNKRKRCEDDILGNSQKIFRRESIGGMPTPRSLKIKSQSFCIGAANNVTMDQNSLRKDLCRTRSDTVFNSSQLSDSHKKKLLWAVSQALQHKQVSAKHPSFKLYASTLARVVKRIYLETDEKGISTSDRMLKIAKKYVYWVTQGKSADDIYLSEKTKLEYEKQSSRTKLSGYIAPEEYESRKLFLKKTSSSLLLENDSNCGLTLSQSLIGFSQSSQLSGNSDFMSQTLHDSQIMRDQSFSSAKKQLIQTNKTLQNSSSKNNLCGTTALRENVDCEQRKSAQKCFTGKDQRNVSPYRDSSVSGRQKHTSVLLDTNAMKAKRQITFDN